MFPREGELAIMGWPTFTTEKHVCVNNVGGTSLVKQKAKRYKKYINC